ncbi:MAG: DNA polymerase III subunit gamma/tau [Saprospiraceae bacterium]|nr:DNA polymerase III subunit gamma/tau [Saprospiraceae bacterium]
MSQFVVSARKYRPTTFEDVIGQNHVARTLKNALQSDKLAHAFLFCGPRGVGKTTCARILAKVINCLTPVDKVAPCNQCSSCKSFNENASFNIIELDAASNNSVEHIRTLIEQVRFQPQQGSHKVFIIDEVHMLSTQAFNAFLKTLEEPPPYAIFILATTEKHKILPTILSRCQIFDFKRIQTSDIVEQLQRILTNEGKTADVEALHQIAQKADGGMRDALSIFDKVASAVDGNITYKDVIQHLNVLDYEYFFKTIDACLRGDAKDAFLIVDDVIKNGFEPDHFIQGIAEHVRNLFLSKDTTTINLLDCSEELRQRYYNQSTLASEAFLLSALDMTNQCDINLPRSSNKRLLTELTLSKLAHLNHLVQGNIFAGNQSSQEKKTPDLNNTRVNTPDLSNKTTESPRLTSSATPTQSAASTSGGQRPADLPDQENAQFVEEAASQPMPELPKNLLTGASGPLKSKVADLRKKLMEEEAQKLHAQKGFNLESVQKIWDDYHEANSSMSTKTAMKHSILEIEDKKLKVSVPNAATKNIILQENMVVDRIRDNFGLNNLILEVEIDKSKFPDVEETQIKQTLTTREVYEHFKAKNELFAEFVRRFDLKPETHHS